MRSLRKQLKTDSCSVYLVEAYISAHQYLVKYTALAPTWIWLALPVLTTAIGQQIMAWLHSGDEDVQRQRNAADGTPADAAHQPKSQ